MKQYNNGKVKNVVTDAEAWENLGYHMYNAEQLISVVGSQTTIMWIATFGQAANIIMYIPSTLVVTMLLSVYSMPVVVIAFAALATILLLSAFLRDACVYISG